MTNSLILLALLIVSGDLSAVEFKQGKSFPSIDDNGITITPGVLFSTFTAGGDGGQVSISTNGYLTSNKACPAGFTRVGLWDCWDTDMEAFEQVVSSIITGNVGSSNITYLTTSTASTIDCARGLAGSGASIRAQVLQGQGTGNGTQVGVFLRATGSAVEDYTIGNAVSRSRVADTDVNDFAYDVGNSEVILNASGQFDYACRGVGSIGDNTASCNLALVKLMNCR